MKIKQILFLLLLNAWVFGVSAQNLVRNSDFEFYTDCPETFTQWNAYMRVLIPEWNYPSKGTPDYFHPCNKGMVGVPRNFAGDCEPHSGKAYAGIIAKGSRDNYREYIQTQLNKPLEAGKKYCVTFYWSLSMFSKYSVDQMGIFFYKDRIYSEEDKPLAVKPQVVNEAGKYLDTKGSWEEFCGTYTAHGGERFIVIGNFSNDVTTVYQNADVKNIKPKRQKEYAYYYIDDVSVVSLSDCATCSCSMDNVIDADIKVSHVRNYGKADGAVTVDILYGAQPLSFKWSNGLETKDVSGIAAGKYQLTVTDGKGCPTVFDVEVLQPDTIFASIDVGVPKALRDVLFYFDKVDFLPTSYKQLGDLLAYMEEHPTLEIKLLGHTDNYGTPQYNADLSNNRAKAVVEYLIKQGIDAKRLSYEGFGATKPVSANDTDEGRQLNRRVEFMVVKQ